MKNMEKLFQQIAEEENTTVENVHKEITYAIETAMKNSSPDNMKIFKSISATGKTPTSEEFIIYLCNNILFPKS